MRRTCSLAVEFGPSSVRGLLRPLLTSPSASLHVAVHLLGIVPKPKEISQGKTLILRSVAAGFTNARVCLAFGRPRPMPGYPTAPAFYPVPVRQLRVLLPASSPPRLATTQLPSASGSGQPARRGHSPPRSTPCLAHKKEAPTSERLFKVGGADLFCRLGLHRAPGRLDCGGLRLDLRRHLGAREASVMAMMLGDARDLDGLSALGGKLGRGRGLCGCGSRSCLKSLPLLRERRCRFARTQKPGRARGRPRREGPFGCSTYAWDNSFGFRNNSTPPLMKEYESRTCSNDVETIAGICLYADDFPAHHASLIASRVRQTRVHSRFRNEFNSWRSSDVPRRNCNNAHARRPPRVHPPSSGCPNG